MSKLQVYRIDMGSYIIFLVDFISLNLRLYYKSTFTLFHLMFIYTYFFVKVIKLLLSLLPVQSYLYIHTTIKLADLRLHAIYLYIR